MAKSSVPPLDSAAALLHQNPGSVHKSPVSCRSIRIRSGWRRLLHDPLMVVLKQKSQARRHISGRQNNQIHHTTQRRCTNIVHHFHGPVLLRSPRRLHFMVCDDTSTHTDTPIGTKNRQRVSLCRKMPTKVQEAKC